MIIKLTTIPKMRNHVSITREMGSFRNFQVAQQTTLIICLLLGSQSKETVMRRKIASLAVAGITARNMIGDESEGTLHHPAFPVHMVIPSA